MPHSSYDVPSPTRRPRPARARRRRSDHREPESVNFPASSSAARAFESSSTRMTAPCGSDRTPRSCTKSEVTPPATAAAWKQPPSPATSFDTPTSSCGWRRTTGAICSRGTLPGVPVPVCWADLEAPRWFPPKVSVTGCVVRSGRGSWIATTVVVACDVRAQRDMGLAVAQRGIALSLWGRQHYTLLPVLLSEPGASANWLTAIHIQRCQSRFANLASPHPSPR